MEKSEQGRNLRLRGLMYRNIMILGLFISLVSLYFVSREVFVGLAQKSDKKAKQVTWSKWGNEPIEIEGLSNAARSFRFDEEFEQESEWLKDFSVRIKNKSGKNIKFIRLSLDFLETASTGNLMTFPMSFGKNPADRRTDLKPSVLPVGESVTLTLTEKQYKQLKTFVESRQQIEELRKLQITVIKVLYEDDTGWNLGNQIRMEPGNPRPVIVHKSKDSGGQ